MKAIFRVWNPRYNDFNYWGFLSEESIFTGVPSGAGLDLDYCKENSEQITGLKDVNGNDIYEGDILEFTDKWEWYRGQWASKFFFAETRDVYDELMKQFDALPTHKLVVEMSAEEGVNFSTYDLGEGRWKVIGNIHENKNLL